MVDRLRELRFLGARRTAARDHGVTIVSEAMRRLFSFPNPVNETSARLVAGAVALLALSAIASRQGAILPLLAYGFVARALAGPRLSPLALIATRLVTPRLSLRHRYAPGPAKRFAQTIGALLTVTATGLYYLADQHASAFGLIAVLAVFASLEAVLGLCVGCRIFYLGIRLGLVPERVCIDCARLSEIRGL